MSFVKKTINDVKITGKAVLLSVDYNVPGDASGNVADDYRIRNSLPTINYLLKKNCRVVIISHRGRPGGKPKKEFSLRHVASSLQKLLGQPVQFVADCIGPEAQEAKNKLGKGQVLLLENTRFHAEEEANDATFAKQLAQGMDFFVQDAFGNAHRSHASTVAITKYLPAVAGLLVEHEVTTITAVRDNPKRPLVAIIGGAKIADKITLLNRFLDTADVVVVGGAMANTFLRAKGIGTGKSIVDTHEIPVAKEIMAKVDKIRKKRPFVFYLPQDGVVALNTHSSARTRIVDWSAHIVASIENYPKRPGRLATHVASDEMILDIGPFSGAFISGVLQLANTAIWNGTMGVTETRGLNDPIGPFAHGSELIVDALLGEYGHKPYSLVGGGDTAGYIASRKLLGHFNHVSTGGGASLDLLGGGKLPAVEALQDA